MILAFLFLLFGSDKFHPDHVYRQVKETHHSVPFELPERRFHLIGKGSQFFAFESEDHKIVLKLFKARHHLSKFPKRVKLFFSSDLQKKSEARWKKKFLDTCQCYELAFEELREETGLIALHFNKTEANNQLVTLIDGKKQFVLDLNTVPFVVQKKAILLPNYLRKLSNKEEQKTALEKVKDLFDQRIKKKITDHRQSLRINYGFIDGKAVQIDPGKIYKDEQIDTLIETQRLNSRVDRWVKKHFPDLILQGQ